MAKRRAGSQTVSLTPDHKKSGIDLIYLAVGGVPHIVGKLSTRATTLLQTTPQSEVCLQSYGAPKLRESQLAGFRDSHSRIPGKKSHLDVGSVASHRVNPFQGGRQQPLQSLEKLRKYKGGSRRHEMAALPSPKMWPWSHLALKACSMLIWLSWFLFWLEDLMAFQVAMLTSVVASHAWSRTFLREYWPSKCLRHLSDQR